MKTSDSVDYSLLIDSDGIVGNLCIYFYSKDLMLLMTYPSLVVCIITTFNVVSLSIKVSLAYADSSCRTLE